MTKRGTPEPFAVEKKKPKQTHPRPSSKWRLEENEVSDAINPGLIDQELINERLTAAGGRHSGLQSKFSLRNKEWER